MLDLGFSTQYHRNKASCTLNGSIVNMIICAGHAACFLTKFREEQSNYEQCVEHKNLKIALFCKSLESSAMEGYPLSGAVLRAQCEKLEEHTGLQPGNRMTPLKIEAFCPNTDSCGYSFIRPYLFVVIAEPQ